MISYGKYPQQPGIARSLPGPPHLHTDSFNPRLEHTGYRFALYEWVILVTPAFDFSTIRSPYYDSSTLAVGYPYLHTTTSRIP